MAEGGPLCNNNKSVNKVLEEETDCGFLDADRSLSMKSVNDEVDQVEASVQESRNIEHTSDEIVELGANISTFGFDVRTDKTDLTLEIQGHQIFVSKVVLEIISPVFKDLLSNSNNSTPGNKHNMNIKMNGKKFQDFVEFLACVYPGKSLKITLDNVHRILPLASEFKIGDVTDKCEAVLIKAVSEKCVAVKLAVQCLDHSCRYTLPELKDKSIDTLKPLLMANIEHIDDAFDICDEGKLLMYGSLIPDIRREMSRQRFLLAGLMQSNDIVFDDPKTKTVKFEISHKGLFGAEDAVFETDIWTVGVKGKLTKEKLSNNIKVNIAVVHPKLTTCLISVILVVENQESDKGNFRFSMKKGLPNNDTVNPWLLSSSFNLDEIKYQELGSRHDDGKYHISAHILMNKPHLK